MAKSGPQSKLLFFVTRGKTILGEKSPMYKNVGPKINL